MDNPTAPQQPVQPQPGPFTWGIDRVGEATLNANGDKVALLRLTLHHAAGATVLFLSAPDAIAFADQLVAAGSGITIAHDLGGLNVSGAVVLHPTVLVCPNCTTRKLAAGPMPPAGWGASEMHPCAGLRGMIAPLVPEGQACKVEAIEREDYLGDDAGRVRVDGEGRPIMTVKVTRDDGEDVAAMAPVATGRAENR